MFINQLFSCQACGALWPKLGRDARRVGTFKWVCSPACNNSYLSSAAGLVDTENGLVHDASYSHRRNNMAVRAGEAPHGLELAGALPPETVGQLADYREQIERIVDAINPQTVLGEYRGS